MTTVLSFLHHVSILLLTGYAGICAFKVVVVMTANNDTEIPDRLREALWNLFVFVIIMFAL